MKSLSHKILSKIRKEHITPKPKWYFVLIHTLLWSAVIISIVLGGLAFSIILRNFSTEDWIIARHFAGGHIRSFFVVLPYLWFILVILVLLLAKQLLTHTKKGYKIRPHLLTGATIALSFMMGALFYATNWDISLEHGLRSYFKPYEKFQEYRERRWVAPAKGVLAGTISQIDSENHMMVIDFHDQQWTIDTSETVYRNDFEPNIDDRVRMMGESQEEHQFKAERMSLFDQSRGFRHR